MLTIDILDKYGANTKDGLERCLNNKELYLKLINKLLNDDSFDKLKSSILINDLDNAFKISHSLKGVLANLSITPLYDIVYELTELLRNKSNTNYKIYIDNLFIKRNELIELSK